MSRPNIPYVIFLTALTLILSSASPALADEVWGFSGVSAMLEQGVSTTGNSALVVGGGFRQRRISLDGHLLKTSSMDYQVMIGSGQSMMGSRVAYGGYHQTHTQRGYRWNTSGCSPLLAGSAGTDVAMLGSGVSTAVEGYFRVSAQATSGLICEKNNRIYLLTPVIGVGMGATTLPYLKMGMRGQLAVDNKIFVAVELVERVDINPRDRTDLSQSHSIDFNVSADYRFSKNIAVGVDLRLEDTRYTKVVEAQPYKNRANSVVSGTATYIF